MRKLGIVVALTFAMLALGSVTALADDAIATLPAGQENTQTIVAPAQEVPASSVGDQVSGGDQLSTGDQISAGDQVSAGNQVSADKTGVGGSANVSAGDSTDLISDQPASDQPGSANTTDQLAAGQPEGKMQITPAGDPLPPSLKANDHVQDIGWEADPADDSTWNDTTDASGAITVGTTGKALRLEALQLELDGDYPGGVEYQVHVSNIGWMDWTGDGDIAGTTGKALSIEALRIRLTGDVGNDYSVYYQAHVQDMDWLPWTSDGLSAGSAGFGRRLEAIRVMLVRNGNPAPETGGAFVVSGALSGRGHVQNIGWQPERAANSGQTLTIGTTGQALRLEALQMNLNTSGEQGSISYNAHVQNIGWQHGMDDESSWFGGGSVVGTTDHGLRMEALQFNLTGDYAKDFDLYYRVHVADLGWLGWTGSGLTAGTAGMSVPIEAVQLVLVPKGTQDYTSDQIAYVDAGFLGIIQAAIATDDGDTAMDGVSMIRRAGYLFLPSYATSDNTTLNFPAGYGNIYLSDSPLASSSWTQVSGGTASIPAAMFPSAAARPVYLRAGDHCSPMPLHVMKSNNLESIFLISDDPVGHGRAYIDGSWRHKASTTGSALVVSASGDTVYDGKLTQIRGRGNTSWNKPQKPYQIKLDKKASLIDGTKANKAKTWLLISTYADPSFMRNYISYKMATAAGLEGTTDCDFVDLYYDGEYRGTYLLTEKVEIKDGRLEIDNIENESSVGGESADDIESHATATGQNRYGMTFQYVTGISEPADTTGGYLIELDNGYYREERSWFTATDGTGFALSDPKDASYDEVRYISEVVQHAMNHACEPGQFDQLMDADTAVGTWLVQTLAGNPDYYSWSSTYFYKKAGDPKLYSGPVWDMNLAYGIHNPTNGYDYCDPNIMGSSEKVFYYNSPDFRREARDRYNNRFAGMVSDLLGQTDNGTVESIDEVASRIDDSRAMNEVVWGVTNEGSSPVWASSFGEAVSYLKSWTARHAEFLDRTMNSSSWC